MRLDGNKRDMERHRGIFQAGQSCERGDGGTTCFDRRCKPILGFQRWYIFFVVAIATFSPWESSG